MTDLVEFLTAQYDRRAKAANLMAKYYPPPWEVFDRGWMARVYGEEPFWEVTRLEQGAWAEEGGPGVGEIIEHVALHGPDYVLADIESKRQIVELHHVVSFDDEDGHDIGRGCAECGYSAEYSDRGGYCETVRLLAAPFSGEPGYKAEEWAV